MAEAVSYDWQSRPFFFVCWGKGKNLSWDPRQNQGPDKHQRLKRHLQTLSQATHPCSIAYSYVRIRRLVRLGGGFYCGAVADESAIGFDRPPNIKARQRSARVQALSEIMSRWLCVGHL
ncbi:hypothetical protein, partial [Pseudomonas sp. NPDC087639]|uniref:hypothetical protein n=1 Tax=Pseudomonas sp. NPDC087639 TaxID=3364445 RepID=UPI003817107C